MDQKDDLRLLSERFPRSSQYHPEWVIENAFGANALWLTEWLASAVDLNPGMRVLDLGCGRAKSSVFLAREFGVQVWAADLWISASENIQRIRDAGVEESVFPVHADARALPFAAEFFDAILSVDSFSYYGSDGLYLNYLAHFVKPGGQIGIAGAGLVREFDESATGPARPEPGKTEPNRPSPPLSQSTIAFSSVKLLFHEVCQMKEVFLTSNIYWRKTVVVQDTQFRPSTQKNLYGAHCTMECGSMGWSITIAATTIYIHIHVHKDLYDILNPRPLVNRRIA